MAPSRMYPEWNKRQTDKLERRDLNRRYYIICEGTNTEVWYFKKLIDCKKQLNIKPLVDLRLLEKTEEDATNSNPKKLIEFAIKEKNKKGNHFLKGHDKTVVVFDLDIFSGYDELNRVLVCGEEDDIFAISNPCFELFLLLHYMDAYKLYVAPNYEEILANKKINKHTRYLTRLLSDVSGMNPKTNKKIGDLAENVVVAIEEGRNINTSMDNCLEELTCNIGHIIEELIRDGK